MATVFIPAQLREMTAGTRELQIDAANLGELIAALEAQFPGIRDRLCQDDAIAPGLAVSIDGAMTSKGLLAPVQPASEVHFLPAIGGG